MKKEPTYIHSGWSSGANCGSKALGVAKSLCGVTIYYGVQFIQQAIIIGGPEKIYSSSNCTIIVPIFATHSPHTDCCYNVCSYGRCAYLSRVKCWATPNTALQCINNYWQFEKVGSIYNDLESENECWVSPLMYYTLYLKQLCTAKYVDSSIIVTWLKMMDTHSALRNTAHNKILLKSHALL